MKIHRRQVLQAGLFGGLMSAFTFGGLAPAPRLAGAAAKGSGAGLDSYELFRRAIRLGSRIQLGSTARADTAHEDAAIVTIKVMNHIHTPLCFKLGSLDTPYTGTMIPWAQKFSNPATLSLLMGRGLDQVSDIPRFARLRMNKWWADILQSGANETGAVPTILTAADVGAFPADVAIQAALGVSQTDLTLNHSFKNCCLPSSTDANRGGDLGYHVAKQKLIESPLGLVCFNMGNVVETTDSIGNVPNRIVGNDQVTVAALGRTVDAYVKVIGQAIGLGLVDEDLVSKFDAFVGGDSTIAEELKKSRGALQTALSSMSTASAIERSPHVMEGVPAAANFQLVGNAANSVARGEFLSQCKFVQQALDIPGKPFRNFSLFLNVVDLDGAALDTTSATPGSIAQGANPYSYVEGMRQLALGLNMLAKVISKHKNVYVVVVSEGGRSGRRGDDKVSHSIVMGPSGAGNLADHLYANEAAVSSSTDPFVGEPNSGNAQSNGSGQRAPDGQVVINEAGTAIDEQMTTGALLNGLVRHLETKRGAASTTAGLGKFVRLKTG